MKDKIQCSLNGFNLKHLKWLLWHWRDYRIDKAGIQFPRKGDVVIWLWPWRRGANGQAWISIGFSGTGEFGDGTFETLDDLDAAWKDFENTLSNIDFMGSGQ